MKQKIIKAGNSLVVVIPSRFVKHTGVKQGAQVKVSVNYSKGKIVYTFSGVQQLSFTDEIAD